MELVSFVYTKNKFINLFGINIDLSIFYLTKYGYD